MAKYYYCISSSNTSISTSLIESSQRHEFVESTKTIHFACNDEYAYFVVDKSLGEFQFQVNIFRGGFEDAVEITYNSIAYLAYRSHQKLKGEIDIELINTNVSIGHTVALSEIRPRADFAVLQAQYVGYCGQRMDKLIRDWQEVCLEIESIIDQNSKSIATNTTNIATNTANISTNTSDINTLKSKIETLEGGIRLKGRVDSVSLLPTTSEIGDLYLVGLTTDTDLAEYLYTSAGHWELLGKLGDIDLSEYAKKTDIPKDYIRNGSQTSTSTADGGTNIYTFTYADGTTSTFTVKNGTKGTTGAQGPQGEKGDTGATGPQGPKGETGATGSPGPQGPKGDTGADGTNGTNGTSAYWFTGTAVTGTAASVTVSVSGSKSGDMYLNTSTWNVYTATAANTWKYCCNIKGAAGQNATTTAVASKNANGLCPQLPNETTTTKYLRQDGSWQVPPNTTYSSKSAASGGTDVSLVTTGEKYAWNSKTSNTGTVTSVAVKMNGSTKGTVTSSGTIDLGTVITSHQDISGKQDMLTAGSNITISGSTISAKDTTYSVATTSANGLMSSTDKSKLDGIASGANNYSLPERLAEKVTCETSNPSNIVNNGFYYSTSGGPFESYHSSKKDFMIIDIHRTTNWASQIATDFRTNKLAVRNKNNGTWNSWNTLASNSVATTSENGLMSSSDKSKLNSLSNLFTIIEE